MIYIGYGFPPGVVAAGRGTLKWVHSGTAGVGASLPLLAGTGIVLTNSAAVHAEPLADWVIAAIAYFARGLDRMREAQAAGQPVRDEITELRRTLVESPELPFCVLGFYSSRPAVRVRS